MHDFNIEHRHVLQEEDFRGCCLDCRRSLEIIKPHVMAFYRRIRGYTRQDLAALPVDELYRLYQALDDIAHLNVGDHLAGLILKESQIRRALPTIRAYYAAFFSLHEIHQARRVAHAQDPRATLETFPLYERYRALIRSQVEAYPLPRGARVAFIGCGPFPVSIVLLAGMHGVRCVGLDTDPEAVALARRCVGRLGLADRVSILRGDESALEGLEWDTVVVAALAEPKARIFRTLHRLLAGREGARVCLRTYTGIRAVLYHPVRQEDLQGFRRVAEIAPAGRVNNTLVFLERA